MYVTIKTTEDLYTSKYYPQPETDEQLETNQIILDLIDDYLDYVNLANSTFSLSAENVNRFRSVTEGVLDQYLTHHNDLLFEIAKFIETESFEDSMELLKELHEMSETIALRMFVDSASNKTISEQSLLSKQVFDALVGDKELNVDTTIDLITERDDRIVFSVFPLSKLATTLLKRHPNFKPTLIKHVNYLQLLDIPAELVRAAITKEYSPLVLDEVSKEFIRNIPYYVCDRARYSNLSNHKKDLINNVCNAINIE